MTVSLSGPNLPDSFTPTVNMLTSHFTHTDVRPYGTLDLAEINAEGNGTFGTPDV